MKNTYIKSGNLFFYFMIAAQLLGCSYMGRFTVTNAMKSDITVLISTGKEFAAMIRTDRMHDLPSLCVFDGEDIECDPVSPGLELKKYYDPASQSFRIIIPPGRSLILDQPLNFFGFSSENSTDKLYFMSNIESLTILTSDGKRLLEGKEILKAFSPIERHWWDLRIEELY